MEVGKDGFILDGEARFGFHGGGSGMWRGGQAHGLKSGSIERMRRI